VIALIGSIAGGVLPVEQHSTKVDQVYANAQQIAIMKIEKAYRAGKNQRHVLRRLCDDFQRTHRWVPSACQK